MRRNEAKQGETRRYQQWRSTTETARTGRNGQRFTVRGSSRSGERVSQFPRQKITVGDHITLPANTSPVYRGERIVEPVVLDPEILATFTPSAALRVETKEVPDNAPFETPAFPEDMEQRTKRLLVKLDLAINSSKMAAYLENLPEEEKAISKGLPGHTPISQNMGSEGSESETLHVKLYDREHITGPFGYAPLDYAFINTETSSASDRITHVPQDDFSVGVTIFVNGHNEGHYFISTEQEVYRYNPDEELPYPRVTFTRVEPEEAYVVANLSLQATYLFFQQIKEKVKEEKVAA